MKKSIVGAALLVVLALTGCAGQTAEEKGTKNGVLIGAGAGAILGQVIGRNTQGTLIGAAAGAAVGGLVGNRVGNYMDKQEEELRKAAAASQALTVQRAKVAEVDAIVATFKSDVLFDVGSASLKTGANSEMDRIAGILQKYPETKLKVEGHTDSSGSESFNRKLSEKRAEAVKTALVQRTVAPERITTAGYGASMPVSPDAAQNRRVNIVILPTAAS